MNDKCRVKMIRKELYNVKNPLCKRGGKNQKRMRKEVYQELHIKKSPDIRRKLQEICIYVAES